LRKLLGYGVWVGKGTFLVGEGPQQTFVGRSGWDVLTHQRGSQPLVECPCRGGLGRPFRAFFVGGRGPTALPWADEGNAPSVRRSGAPCGDGAFGSHGAPPHGCAPTGHPPSSPWRRRGNPRPYNVYAPTGHPPRAVGNRPANAQVVQVTNAFRQGVLGGQEIELDGLDMRDAPSPMPFGRESWGDPKRAFFWFTVTGVKSPMPFGRESWGDLKYWSH